MKTVRQCEKQNRYVPQNTNRWIAVLELLQTFWF